MALTDDGLELAATRDAVLVDAQQAAINLNTLDHNNVAAGLDLWEQTSTGTLLEEFRSNRAEYEKVVTDSGAHHEATVKDAAVARAGRARRHRARARRGRRQVTPDGPGPRRHPAAAPARR